MMKKLVLCMVMAVHTVSAKVLIFTYAYNRPDFIEIQHRTFQKFLKDEYEFVVFNDAQDPKLESLIRRTCHALGIGCVRIPQEIHSRPYLPRLLGENYNHPSVRNCNVVQYSLNTRGFDHDDILVLLDSDVFLVRPLCIRDMLDGYDLAAMQLGNGHVKYLWHGLTFLNMKTLPNIRTLNVNCGKIDGHPIDAGGYSYYYLKNNPSIKALYVDYQYSGHLRCDKCKTAERPLCPHNGGLLQQLGFDANQIRFLSAATNVEFYHNHSFLHYRGGTNWDNQSNEFHRRKTEALKIYLAAILS